THRFYTLSLRDAFPIYPTVREAYQARLVEAGVLSAEEAEGKVSEAMAELARHQASLRKGVEDGEGELDRGSEAIPPVEIVEPERSEEHTLNSSHVKISY